MQYGPTKTIIKSTVVLCGGCSLKRHKTYTDENNQRRTIYVCGYYKDDEVDGKFIGVDNDKNPDWCPYK